MAGFPCLCHESNLNHHVSLGLAHKYVNQRVLTKNFKTDNIKTTEHEVNF